MKTALIAMSGGVDSSVAALLMKQKGYSCVGATMKLFHNEDIGLKKEKTCCSLDDVEDARLVAHKLGMPYYVFNFSDLFADTVIRRFIEAYEKGYTPNPCIDCNRFLKFEKLFLRMKELNLDTIVTGHYARVCYDENRGRWMLKKGLDNNKDQSYVLYNLTQEQLAHVQFPVGELRKSQVRELAEEMEFYNAQKPDSQDICFVPDGDYAGFIERYTGKKCPKGEFHSVDGKVLGEHKGIIHYTVGQRRGLGISAANPLYVCDICTANNVVTLGEKENLFASELVADDINLISYETITEPISVEAKIRYRHPAEKATAWLDEEGKLRVKFDEPQRAITCGQAVVLYQGEEVVGGGRIIKVVR